jgi:NitT/TauT family transport system substrate-binding protein
MPQRAARSVFLAGVGAGLAAPAAPSAVRAQAAQKVRAAGVFSDLFGEPWYAKESGIFAKSGFDLEVSPLVNAGAVAAAIGGGALEMGVGDLVSGVNAINAGVPIVLVAGSGLWKTTEPFSYIATLKDSPIKSVKDLAGKTIAVPTLVGLTTASVRAWLTQNGVSLESVKLVEFPAPALLGAMQKGSIDAGLTAEPFITPVKDQIRDVGHPYDAIAKEFLLGVWYANKSWVDADRERARKAVAAIYETARWANTHRDETFTILVREGKLEGDKLKGMGRVSFATSLTPALVQPVLNTATAVKIFDRQMDANALITRL